MFFLFYLSIFWQYILPLQFTLAESNTTTNCTTYKENFRTAVSNFSFCAISNSHPITLCEFCIDDYINVIDSYRNLSKLKDEKGFCAPQFMNLDRLGIIVNMFEGVYNLWNNAQCNKCYELVNGVLTHNLSSETIQFNKLHSITRNCINSSSPETICDLCLENYLNLNDYYNSITDKNVQIGMCMDTVDLMNTTRLEWSEKCCRYRRHPEYIFIGSAVGMMIITILFYLLIKLLIDKRAPKIIMQSRFAESLSSSSRR